MTWRKSTTFKDRILASLPYLVPLLEVVLFGSFLFVLLPPLALLFTPLMPLLPIYFFEMGGIGVVQFGVFLALYLGVVRDESLSHFLRFNTMQAMLLGIFAALCSAALRLLGLSQELVLSRFTSGLDGAGLLFTGGVGMLIIAIIYSTIFLVVVAASVYSVVQSLRGVYAEVPLISEAAYSQVR